MGMTNEIELLGKKILYHTINKATQWRVDTIFTKEPITIEWVKSIAPGEVVFDVGANVGMYSMMLASRGATVYAFEPDFLNYACLNRNIRLNNFEDQILAYCVGVLDFDGFSVLNSERANPATGDSMYTAHEELNFKLQPANVKHKQAIPIITLDKFCSSLSIQPDHIKIDVDGLDYKIVEGNIKTIKNVKTAIIELNPKWPQHKAAIDLMKALGFQLDSYQVIAA